MVNEILCSEGSALLGPVHGQAICMHSLNWWEEYMRKYASSAHGLPPVRSRQRGNIIVIAATALRPFFAPSAPSFHVFERVGSHFRKSSYHFVLPTVPPTSSTVAHPTPITHAHVENRDSVLSVYVSSLNVSCLCNTPLLSF